MADAAGLALNRLKQERKNWKKSHPPGFVAKPVSTEEGALDLFVRASWALCWAGTFANHAPPSDALPSSDLGLQNPCT